MPSTMMTPEYVVVLFGDVIVSSVVLSTNPMPVVLLVMIGGLLNAVGNVMVCAVDVSFS